MVLTETEAQMLCSLLEEEGFDPTMTEEKLPTGKYHVITPLEEGQTVDDVSKLVQSCGFDSAEITHVPALGSIHVS